VTTASRAIRAAPSFDAVSGGSDDGDG
jgi:hypothetical protein